jgi:hypothetical protein
MSAQRLSDLELIEQLGARWRELREKYGDEDDKTKTFEERALGWRALAVGLAITALAEEHFNVKHYRELLRR